MLDQSSPALIHTVSKFLAALAPSWGAGPTYQLALPPCVALMDSNALLYSTQYALG